MDTYGPRQDEWYLESASGSDLCEEHCRKVYHLSSSSFYFPVNVLSREFDWNHHHPPVIGPEDNWPEVRAIQYMSGDICPSVGSPGGVPHFVSRVNESYVRVPVDGLTCSQEVDNLTNGPVDQFPVCKILESPLIKLCHVCDPMNYSTLMSMT